MGKVKSKGNLFIVGFTSKVKEMAENVKDKETKALILAQVLTIETELKRLVKEETEKLEALYEQKLGEAEEKGVHLGQNFMGKLRAQLRLMEEKLRRKMDAYIQKVTR